MPSSKQKWWKFKNHKEKQTENWITLVSGVIAASSNLGLEQSTKEIFNPNSVATCLKYLFVPPYTSSIQIIWSPAFKRWVMVTVAAKPEAKAKPKIKTKLE